MQYLKKLVSNIWPDDDPIRVETCSLLLSTIKMYVFDILLILIFAVTVTQQDV